MKNCQQTITQLSEEQIAFQNWIQQELNIQPLVLSNETQHQKDKLVHEEFTQKVILTNDNSSDMATESNSDMIIYYQLRCKSKNAQEILDNQINKQKQHVLLKLWMI